MANSKGFNCLGAGIIYTFFFSGILDFFIGGGLVSGMVTSIFGGSGISTFFDGISGLSSVFLVMKGLFWFFSSGMTSFFSGMTCIFSGITTSLFFCSVILNLFGEGASSFFFSTGIILDCFLGDLA